MDKCNFDLFRNPEKIMENSVWNDDQKTWILPSLMNSIRLPPANLRSAFPKPKIKSIEDNNNNAQYRKVTSTDSSDSDVIIYNNIIINYR